MDERRRSTKTFKDGKEGLGQNGLYWKLMRTIAKKLRAGGDKTSEKVLVAKLHQTFQLAFNFKVPFPEFPTLREEKGTSHMSVTEFHNYFTECQAAAIRRYGVSGMDEDDAPFDHGGIT